MRTITEFMDWCEGAEEQFGDVTLPIGQMFLRYVLTLVGYEGEDLAASTEGEGSLIIRFTPDTVLRVRVSEKGPEGSAEELDVFGLRRITSGLWQLFPSMNLPGLVHAWASIYNVPEPAPWGKRIVLMG
jgi:hypothetical protein